MVFHDLVAVEVLAVRKVVGCDDENGVELPGGQHAHQGVAALYMELVADQRKELVVIGDHSGKLEISRDPEHADAQRPCLQDTVFFHVFCKLVYFIEDPPGRCDELLPCLGEGDGLGVADKEGDPQLFFQMEDLLGQGGLGEE